MVLTWAVGLLMWAGREGGHRERGPGHPPDGHQVLLRCQVPIPLFQRAAGRPGHSRLLQQLAQTVEKSVSQQQPMTVPVIFSCAYMIAGEKVFRMPA